MSTRELKLSRRWSILADPQCIGIDQEWFKRLPTEGWRSIRADRAWQHVLGEDFHSVAWYRRRARLPKKWFGKDTRIWLRFESVATDCTVWVNGIPVGQHVGDYLPFQFEMTDALAGDERCEIVCRIDEIEGHEPGEWGKEPWGGHITKGFHDVLSLQHGGIWNGVSARRTGPIAFKPNGLRVETDSRSLTMTAHVELEPHDVEGQIRLHTGAPDNRQLAELVIDIEQGQTSRSQVCDLGMERGKGEGTAEYWSPTEPLLYVMDASASIRSGRRMARWTSDEAATRFAFRSIEAGGRDNRQILLNGKPLLVRGVLHWGHEPDHIAPAPTPDQVRAEFSHLRERGFNCVCMCMWYAPEWFYDIADETGMLIWQEHPVWKSDMSDEHIDEYRRLFEGFLRRDAQHPSIVIVSATCEHEKFNPELASWWWERANELLPDKLLQLQTAFLSWTDNEKTDLYDEHTYENTGRWLPYLADLKCELDEFPPKPFVMGETIIANHWPDIAAIDRKLDEMPHERGHEPTAEYPWWVTRGLDACRAFEANVVERFGQDTLDRFRTQADSFSLEHRKRQVEALRASGLCAGWVMNHIRDVPKCRCGFMDDTDRWRFTSGQTLPWLGETTLCLQTPSGLRAFTGDSTADCTFVVSDGSTRPAEDGLRIYVDNVIQESVSDQGRIPISLPRVDRPTPVHLRAEYPGAEPNAWALWSLPNRVEPEPDLFRLVGLEFTDEERELTFEERKYSSGWGLERTSWKPTLPDSASLFPNAICVDPESVASCSGVLITHRLTPAVLSFVESGGRAVLLASRATDGLNAKTVDLWGQVPLVIERGPIGAGESACILDLLHLDLTQHHQRAVPTDEMGIADLVDPFIRLVQTHDDGAPTIYDALFATRVGEGLLAVSSLDHSEPAGEWLLDRVVTFASTHDPATLRQCPLDLLTTH